MIYNYTYLHYIFNCTLKFLHNCVIILFILSTKCHYYCQDLPFFLFTNTILIQRSCDQVTTSHPLKVDIGGFIHVHT